MEITNLNKNLTEILKDKYIVPLYQRNFAWGVDEIAQLLQDVYESFHKNPNGNYFIGSLVVLKRKNADFEIIDGQQRLTAITLIAKILGIEEIKEPKMFYDSRPEVEAFFNSFYRTGNTLDVTFDHKVSHLVNAVDIINETKLKPDDENSPTINSLDNDLQSFKDYFFKNVIIVRVEIPEDTDVANYFEIMNNRGEQLQKHEILKAKLLDKIKNEKGEHDKKLQAVFAKIWDACSQIDIHIQKLFTSNDRRIYFGDDYNCFTFHGIENIETQTDETSTISTNQNTVIIDTILTSHSIISDGNTINEDIDDEGEDKSIIDFSNFLMHILKLLYNDDYRSATKNEKNQIGLDIPLNEKDLLSVFAKIESKIDSMSFISKLLYFRTVFDRYILKATIDEKSEDDYFWSLEMPYKYIYEKRNATSLKYKNTFDNQERIVKCLSMLQVTYRTRIYKNWLQEVLGWFSETANFNIQGVDFQKRLDELVCKYFNENNEYSEIKIENYYSKGTNTPHFLFNFIDYLYWVESKFKVNNITGIKFVNDFDFKYRNSVEHHRPQSRKQNIDDVLINCLGNLCIVSKNSNSKMNNEEPSGKAIAYNSDKLPPKRKIMYETTKNSSSELKWGEAEIKQHYSDVVIILEKRKEILGITEKPKI